SVTMSWTDSGPDPLEWASAAVALHQADRHVSVGLDVKTTGCALGGGPNGAAFVLPAVLALLGLASRRRAGTSAGQSRGTDGFMRLHASRTQAAPPPIAEPELDGTTLARAKAGDRRARAAIVHRYA